LFCLYFLQGEKNNGFDVLYHNMKHGQISSKELSDFIRERVTIEETYSRSMSKLAKSASNFSQLGTFAPIWDVFKVSTEKLASCHMELVRKLQELIKEVQKYVDEQAKAHKKTKEEVASTLEAVQNIQSVSQALQKSKENYNSKTLEQERMRKEGATQRDLDKTGVKVKKATEVYKSFVEKYATTKTEFEQKMAETAQKFQDIEESHILHMKEIIQSYSCSVEDTHKQIEELHQEFVNNMENTSVESLIQKLAESKGTGKERPGKRKHNNSLLIHLNLYDSEEEDERRKFHVEIKPVQPNNGTHQHKATIDELKASIGNITLSPSATVRHTHTHTHTPTTPLGAATIVPPPRPSSRPKLGAGKLSERPLFYKNGVTNSSPPPAAPLARAESSSSLSSNTSLSASNTPTVGTSRGPSPVTLASQDALPIAVAFTESVNAYFKGADPSKCIVKITGDMTLSFPSGIIKIFTSSPSPAVLSFKLKNTSKLEQILPNQHLLHSDSSQSDTNTRDFWLNMPALTAYLRKNSEQNPTSSYYNVDVLKYQVCSNGIQSTPLNLAVYWKCGPTTTDLRVDYRYNPEAMQPHGPLSSVQVLVPVNGGVTNMQSIPNAIWNADQNKSLWKLNDISEKSENEGSGSLRAKFELSDGPSIPATLAVQFFNEGSTLSGVDMELVGSGYRLSLNKKRFASGKTFHLSFYRPNSA
uniref:F-BAR domain only protein 2 n=1 Tax=Astyanax mexicanus TaxID=7994 RepID=A0A8B9KUG3_ASTMX